MEAIYNFDLDFKLELKRKRRISFFWGFASKRMGVKGGLCHGELSFLIAFREKGEGGKERGALALRIEF